MQPRSESPSSRPFARGSFYLTWLVSSVACAPLGGAASMALEWSQTPQYVFDIDVVTGSMATYSLLMAPAAVLIALPVSYAIVRSRPAQWSARARARGSFYLSSLITSIICAPLAGGALTVLEWGRTASYMLDAEVLLRWTLAYSVLAFPLTAIVTLLASYFINLRRPVRWSARTLTRGSFYLTWLVCSVACAPLAGLAWGAVQWSHSPSYILDANRLSSSIAMNSLSAFPAAAWVAFPLSYLIAVRRRTRPPTAPWLDAARCVATDTACLTCGYNLRTLPVDAECPECGCAVVAARPLSDQPVAVLRRLRTVLWILMCALLASCVAMPLYDWALTTLYGPLQYWSWPERVGERVEYARPIPATIRVRMLLLFICHSAAIVALWRLCRIAPYERPADARRRLRVRVLLAGGLLVAVTIGAMVWPQPVWLQHTLWSALPVRNLSYIALALAMVACLHGLAQRTADAGLRRALTWLFRTSIPIALVLAGHQAASMVMSWWMPYLPLPHTQLEPGLHASPDLYYVRGVDLSITLTTVPHGPIVDYSRSESFYERMKTPITIDHLVEPFTHIATGLWFAALLLTLLCMVARLHALVRAKSQTHDDSVSAVGST